MTPRKDSPLWLRLLTALATADGRYRQASRLRDMPDFLLEDIGITRAEADRAFLQSLHDRPAERRPLTLTRRT